MVSVVETKIDEDKAREIAALHGYVSLCIAELDWTTARELAKFEGEELRLEPFPKMDDRAARELLKIDNSTLVIPTLFANSDQHAIQDDTFLALSRYVESILNFEGWRPLNAASARALVDFGGGQLLVDQDVLDLETATCLALAKPELLSVSVRVMDTEVARALSRSRAHDDLQVVVENGIGAAAALELAQYQGSRLWITWSNGDRIDQETAMALASVKGALRLETDEIDKNVARALARRTGVLDLDCLETLDAETAREFSNAKCAALILDGLQTIDAEVAEELAEYGAKIERSYLSLEGLTQLEPTVARILANSKADWLDLPRFDGRTEMAKVWKAAQAERRFKHFSHVLESEETVAPNWKREKKAIAVSLPAVTIPNNRASAQRTRRGLLNCQAASFITKSLRESSA